MAHVHWRTAAAIKLGKWQTSECWTRLNPSCVKSKACEERGKAWSSARTPPSPPPPPPTDLKCNVMPCTLVCNVMWWRKERKKSQNTKLPLTFQEQFCLVWVESFSFLFSFFLLQHFDLYTNIQLSKNKNHWLFLDLERMCLDIFKE